MRVVDHVQTAVLMEAWIALITCSIASVLVTVSSRIDYVVGLIVIEKREMRCMGGGIKSQPISDMYEEFNL